MGRRILLVAVLSMWTAAGCATPSHEESERTEGAIGAPEEENDEERPAWAEGPVDSQSDERREEPGADGEEPGQRPAERPSDDRERRRRAAAADGLEGVFPDETVNLDFRKARIGRIFRIFKVKARIDLILDSSVKGRLTVSAEETPIEKAFRAVLAAADLTFERRDDVIVVEPK